MKKIGVLIFCLASSGALTAAPAKATVDEGKRLEEAAFQASGKVLECPYRITWENDDRVVYATRGATGKVYRAFSVPKTNLVEIGHAAFEKIQKEHPVQGEPPQNRNYVQPSGGGTLKSPDGTWTAFIRDDNVWLSSKKTGEFQISYDAAPGEPYVSLMWSPDSRKLAGLRERRVNTRQISLIESRPKDSIHARIRTINYAKPGDLLCQRAPTLFLPNERRQVPLTLGDCDNQYDFLLNCWLPDSSAFTFTYTRRGFQVYRYGAIDATTGNFRTLAEEASDKFVFTQKMRHWWLKDGKRFLWISRRDGWKHLYLVSTVDGSQRQLTHGPWNVRHVLRINEEKQRLLLLANGFNAAQGEDPYNMHLLSLDLASGACRDLTPENATHCVCVNPAGTFFTDYYCRPDLAPRFVLRAARDGRIVHAFPAVNVSALATADFPKAEVFHAKGRDGTTDIWGTIWRPLNFNPSNRYPVVEYIYAGPHDAHVPKTFPINPPRGTPLLARGFVVVQIDGMGTDHRSRAFHEVCWRNLKDAGFPDRIPWIKAAASTRPWMDLSRMGIYGYSAGGQNALAALLFHNDFYKAAVALCGCHDNRVDKVWWNEQWMGYPLGPWYAESSNVVNAHRLKGDLFIINGEIDDNVDPISSLQVVDALVKANKDFEQLYLPGFGHNLGSDYITHRIVDFFRRKLR